MTIYLPNWFHQPGILLLLTRTVSATHPVRLQPGPAWYRSLTLALMSRQTAQGHSHTCMTYEGTQAITTETLYAGVGTLASYRSTLIASYRSTLIRLVNLQLPYTLTKVPKCPENPFRLTPFQKSLTALLFHFNTKLSWGLTITNYRILKHLSVTAKSNTQITVPFYFVLFVCSCAVFIQHFRQPFPQVLLRFAVCQVMNQDDALENSRK